MEKNNTKEGGRLVRVVIEGMPGAGKTTTLMGLRKSKAFNNANFVDELSFEGDEIFDSLDDLQKELFYLNGEIEKLNRDKKHKVNLYDRTFFSVLAYSYALEKTKKVQKGFFNKVENELKLAISQDKVTLPDLVILLIIDPITSIERRKKFKNIREYEIWFNTHFLESMYEFYDNIENLELAKTIKIFRFNNLRKADQVNIVKNLIYENV